MKAVVIHSGGMDSSICLALAIGEYGKDHVLSLSFSYGQRHQSELAAAKKIADNWGVAHEVIPLDFYRRLTRNALIDDTQAIARGNTLVVGRNGLLARLGAIFAHSHGAQVIYMGVMGLEEANSGYRDCTREYMDLQEKILRIDLDDPEFEIRTPLVAMTKVQTLAVAEDLGVLQQLLDWTITCYEGFSGKGCGVCPACMLRNEGVRQHSLNRS